MFKSAHFFSFPKTLRESNLSDAHLTEGITAAAFSPCGPSQMQSAGFVPPLTRRVPEEGEPLGELVYQRGNDVWLSLMVEDRVVPRDVVNDAFDQLLKDYRAQNGADPGRRERNALKEQATTIALGKSFTKRRVVDLILHLDTATGVIHTSSRKVAEETIRSLRSALGSMPAVFLNPDLPPGRVMSGWLSGETMPDGLALGLDVELVDPSEKSHKVKASNADLHADEIRNHLQAGMRVSKLGLATPSCSFVLSESLAISKLRLVTEAVTPDGEAETLADAADAMMVLVIGQMRELQNLLGGAFAEPAAVLAKAA